MVEGWCLGTGFTHPHSLCEATRSGRQERHAELSCTAFSHRFIVESGEARTGGKGENQWGVGRRRNSFETQGTDRGLLVNSSHQAEAE